MSDKEQINSSWEKLSKEEYADKLLKHINFPTDNEIHNKKNELYNTITCRINKHQKQKKLKLIVISAAASLFILFSSGYYFLFNDHTTKSNLWAEVITQNGVRDSVLLADGSMVYLNGGSRLKYPLEFSGETRNIIFSGEGYFNIAKKEGYPFLITTETIMVKVLGTKFNLKAYSEDMSVETILEEGRVQLLSTESNILIEMFPDDHTTFNKQNCIFSTEKTDAKNASMWRNGKYSFRSTPFLELAQNLERGFGIEIIFKNPDTMKKRQFTGDFINGESIEEIFSVLKIASQIEYKKENDTYIID